MVRDFLRPDELNFSYDGSVAEEMAYGVAYRDWRDRVDAQPERIQRLLEHENKIARGIGAIAATLFGVEALPRRNGLES